jgi:peptidoglycan/xylan/chitin deacetylase (PgdA/CDA1 family)
LKQKFEAMDCGLLCEGRPSTIKTESNSFSFSPMLRHLRRAAFQLQQSSGIFRWVADSTWRNNRLLILCYHGISRIDEHLWRPGLYMQPEIFRQRLQILQEGKYNVLPLGEGLRRLRAGHLPPRSVAITFDDGGYDFYEAAFPILKSYGFPVTVYQTTYYSDYQKPVFNLVCSYMLWQRRNHPPRSGKEFGFSEPLDLSTESSRARIVRKLILDAEASNLNGAQKDDLAGRLAKHLDIRYDEIVSSRILQLMNPFERAQLAGARVDFQLHTHRHRTPIDENLFRKEIQDNRQSMRPLGDTAIHFCYPSGIYRPEFLGWLREERIVSATTCDPGLVSKRSNPLLLPRLVDTAAHSAVEFEAWLTGLASLLRIRRHAPQILPAAAGSTSQIKSHLRSVVEEEARKG